MNPVIHFEMPSEDEKRVSQFYSSVFGWDMKLMGPQMGNYILATTTETDQNGPKKPGAINGGFFPKKDNPAKCPILVIEVPNIQEHMKKIEAAGGKLLGEPIDIPGIGWYVSFEDTEGNRVNLLQPPSAR
jgi:predicted enzyme related to lactoylglutathione lyase